MKLETLVRIILVFATAIGITFWLLVKDNPRKWLEDNRRAEWRYRIDDKYVDDHRHDLRLLVITDHVRHLRDTVMTIYYPELYAAAAAGDSLYKAPGSVRILLFRKDDTAVLSCDAYVDGETIR